MSRFVLGLFAILMFNTVATAGPGDLFTEKEKDFGVSPKGTVLVHYFRFTNTTKDTISLGQPRVSCGCVTPALSANKVAPGETAVVIAYMDTKRIQHSGVTKTVLVYVPVYTPNLEEVALRVSTVTRDDLMMSPDSLAFGTVTKGKGAKASTKVTFTSDANWTVNKATSTGGFVSVEAKLSSRNGSSVTYDVTATLDKECPTGNWTSDVNLETSHSAVAKLRIPVTVNVTAAVAASPETVAFGDVKMGSTPEQKVTIQGSTPFRILQVKGADAQLTVKFDTDTAKPAHTIVFAANPTAAGGFTRTVEIVTDSKEQPSIIVPVTAKVVNK